MVLHRLQFYPGNILVRASEVEPKGHSYNSLTNLYLDEADQAWANQIEFSFMSLSQPGNGSSTKWHSMKIIKLLGVSGVSRTTLQT